MGVAPNTARTDVASRCLRCMSVLYMPMWFVSAESSFLCLPSTSDGQNLTETITKFEI